MFMKSQTLHKQRMNAMLVSVITSDLMFQAKI